MTSDEIMEMPAEEVFRRVAEILWPRSKGDSDYFVKCLKSWTGIGGMVEAMRQRKLAVAIESDPFDWEWGFYFSEKVSGMVLHAYRVCWSTVAWESCARACLLALAESETSI